MIIKATSVGDGSGPRAIYINCSHVASVEPVMSEYIPGAKSRVRLSSGELLWLTSDADAVSAALWGSAAAVEVQS